MSLTLNYLISSTSALLSLGTGHNTYGEQAWPNDLLYMFPISMLGIFTMCFGMAMIPTLWVWMAGMTARVNGFDFMAPRLYQLLSSAHMVMGFASMTLWIQLMVLPFLEANRYQNPLRSPFSSVMFFQSSLLTLNLAMSATQNWYFKMTLWVQFMDLAIMVSYSPKQAYMSTHLWFILFFQAEHNMLMHPFHMLGAAGSVWIGNNIMTGAVVPTSNDMGLHFYPIWESASLDEWLELSFRLGMRPWITEVALVYGQMNEPPGASMRVGLSALTIDEHLATEMGSFQERITSTLYGSMTSMQAVYVPADDMTYPAPSPMVDVLTRLGGNWFTSLGISTMAFNLNGFNFNHVTNLDSWTSALWMADSRTLAVNSVLTNSPGGVANGLINILALIQTQSMDVCLAH